MSTIEIMIPFAGFYESCHTHMLDFAYEQECGDEDGNFRSECEDCWHSIDYRKVHAKYAKDYADGFTIVHGIKSAEFVSMESPREYNFTTDRLFIRVSREEFQTMVRETDPVILDKTAKELFTSYDGFNSFYSPDWTQWEDFDHNTAHCVLLAWIETKHGAPWSYDQEWELIEDWNCNGELSNMLFDAGLKMPVCANCGSDATPEKYRFKGVSHCAECETPYTAKTDDAA